MKTLSAVRIILVSLLLLGSIACKKTDPEIDGLSFVDGVPYYHFTDDDRRWLQDRKSEEWRFENGRGQQQLYSASSYQELKVARISIPPTGTIVGKSELICYNDFASIYIRRTDSLNQGAQIRFRRDEAMLTTLSSGGYDKSTSRFYAEGEWSNFVGNTDLISDYYSCRGLKFPNGAALNGPFQQLTVRGRTYTEVVAFIGNSRGPTCGPVPSSYMQELYYDRQAGLVRMVSLAGEVWDRVP